MSPTPIPSSNGSCASRETLVGVDLRGDGGDAPEQLAERLRALAELSTQIAGGIEGGGEMITREEYEALIRDTSAPSATDDPGPMIKRLGALFVLGAIGLTVAIVVLFS